MSEIIVKIGGKKFSGWQAITVSQSMQHLVGTFAIRYTDRYPSIERFSFGMGDECIIEVNGNRLITGYIEEIDTRFTSTDHQLEVRGRDKICDLVDCTYWQDGKTIGEWKDQSALSIIEALCSPFLIDVEVDDTATMAVQKNIGGDNGWRTNKGDTITDSLLRICRACQVLPISYGDGKLTLTRAKTDKATTSLSIGDNILSASLVQSDLERYSDYVVLGQDSGDDFKELIDHVQSNGNYQDPLIINRNRFRPVLLLADGKVSSGDCEKRAKWESETRAGKSRIYGCTVAGWLQKSGDIWALNSIAKVKDEVNGVTENLLISRITFKSDDINGTKTDITLMHPDTFKALDLPEPEKASTKYDNLDAILKTLTR